MSTRAPVVIPLGRLADDVLAAIVDDYLLRESTDYGHGGVPLSLERGQVLAQLRTGTAVVVFDPATETCTIVPRDAL